MPVPQHHGNREELRNRHVRFHVRDVYVPAPEKILVELHGEDLLQGKIIDFSDQGSHRDAFAVVEVESLHNPVVLPIAKILDVSD